MANPETTGKSSQHVDDESDEDASEAQAQVIASLRAQVTDLFSQVTQLNGKLVASYDRMSDLEDQLHDASSSLRNASVTISSLELERSHYQAALNTGLLVEKAHVTAELNRLMERATEEAAQRGQAESARHDIEKDLDDLSASLFGQANIMVAEARLGQARSERKVQDAEQVLKFAEDAVKDMQVQMQSLQAAKEAAERDAQEAKLTVRKGKWVEHEDVRIGDVPRIRFMITHTSYAEFIAFVGHMRGLRVSQPTPPGISTLLNQPFIARLLNEDSEPTVRLDIAPSLNWLSRRSVLTAIHTGMLTVEPWSFSSLVQELHQHPQSTSSSTLSCALCGTFIARLPPSTPVSRSHSTNGSSWFKYPLARGTSQNHNPGTPPPVECDPPGQVYIFRLAPAIATPPPPTLPPVHTSSASVSAVGASSRPSLHTVPSSRVLQTQTQTVPYPLCTSNYCLTRLRSTCSLWAFVRVGIVERVWEEGVIQPPKPHVNGDTQESPSPPTSVATASQPASGATPASASEKPPVPPRRKRLWEMASALGERAVSWGKESGENNKEKDKDKEREKEKDNEIDGARRLPIPPPSHPSVPHPHPHAESPTPRVDTLGPPPLPKRNIVHDKAVTDTVVPPSDAQNEIDAPEAKEPDANADDHDDPDKAESNASDLSTSVEEITFTAPPSPPPATMSHPVSPEPSAPPVQDQSSSPTPHHVPLPMTPTTPSHISRVTSPAPRPRSRLSSPASPPPSSRPSSPAVSRSRAGSPTPTGITRTSSPMSGHPPGVTHIRGKSSLSGLASSRPASPALAAGPGAPPVPRRAAARRAVPPPPPTATTGPPAPGDVKGAGEGGKEEVPAPVEATPDPAPAPKLDEGEVSAEKKMSANDAEGEWQGAAEVARESEATGPQDASVAGSATTTEGAPVPAGDAEGAEGALNDVSMTVVVASEPFAPPPAYASEGEARTSMDTTDTKQSSSTEGEGFASDATWEERTWKELVRLKENMFWARIGGIRALQES